MIATACATPIVRAFQASDLRGLVNRDGKQGSVENVLRQASMGPCFTGAVDGKPIACGGMMIPWDGMGIAWMIVAEDAAWHWIWLSKTTKRIFRALVQVHQLHRVEATALVGAPVNQRWLEWIGFGREKDGVARQYTCNQRSMVRYEWVVE